MEYRDIKNPIKNSYQKTFPQHRFFNIFRKVQEKRACRHTNY
jgi:hypothetical protein